MAGRELDVSFRRQRVGVLSDTGAAWRFDYDPDWVHAANGFDLSPALPRVKERIEDGGSQRPVQWFFDNLLPEEEARTLLAREANIPQADAFGLLAWYGAESAGALVLLPPGTRPATGGLQPLPDAELSARIRNLPRQSLALGAPKRMSIAGAQHKLAVVVCDGELYEPVGLTPSTHVLKPDFVHVEHYPHSVANEWFCMTLAARAGLPVPAVAVRFVPEPVYLVERFDRVGTWPNLQRRHVLDACQLLSLERTFKYQQSTADTLVKLVALSREKALTRQRLFRWAVFNALVGNGDAHLKNLSFFVEPAGIGLAPHYDLVSTTSYVNPGEWGAAELSQPMGDARRFGELRRSHVLDFGEVIGVPAVAGTRLLDELLKHVELAAGALLMQIEAGEAFAAHPGELRLMRVIRFGVLRDLQRQLAA